MSDFKQRDTFVYEFEHSYVEMSYSQFLPGYCILFSKIPYASINAMPLAERSAYLTEMSLLGDAMLAVLGDDVLRINYNLLSNSHPVLHAHLFPRYRWEEESVRRSVVWKHDSSKWKDPETQFDVVKHADLKRALHDAIDALYTAYLKG
ncbi:MAG: diadenosine tetraphosphate hydrolase [Aerococcaceae bacterium]|nr:diadenosine tetraphosphate hydrolase [Aerococcaceae bacterium]